MAKKKNILPDNFGILMKEGDFEELKKMYETCEITAHVRGNETDVPFFYSTPCSEFYKWLVEQGLDIHNWGYPPLHKMIAYNGNVEGLILAGADIEEHSYEQRTPLHLSVYHLVPNATKVLVKYNADIHALDSTGNTPLDYLMYKKKPNEAIEMNEIATVLLEAGAEIGEPLREKMKEFEKNFRKNKEFIWTRDNNIKPYEEAMDHLCELFGIEPTQVKKASIEKIEVTATDWIEQHEELWNMLVPGVGKAETVQGEVVRICGRVYDEIANNGGCNWDREYRKMVDSLKKHYKLGKLLSEEEMEEIYSLIKEIKRECSEDIILQLCELNVRWVLQNPVPILLGEVNYTR